MVASFPCRLLSSLLSHTVQKIGREPARWRTMCGFMRGFGNSILFYCLVEHAVEPSVYHHSLLAASLLHLVCGADHQCIFSPPHPVLLPQDLHWKYIRIYEIPYFLVYTWTSMSAVAMMFIRFAGFGRVISPQLSWVFLSWMDDLSHTKTFGKSHGYAIFGGMYRYAIFSTLKCWHTKYIRK